MHNHPGLNSSDHGNRSFSQVKVAKKSSFTSAIKWIVIFLAFAVVTGVNAGILYIGYQRSQSQVVVNTTPKTNEEVAQEVLASFGKLFKLPQDENPSIIRITDVEKLRANQPEFYAEAQNDDYIIVLTARKLAFVYRSTENLIINVGIVSLDSDK